jgi:hypothetical protein
VTGRGWCRRSALALVMSAAVACVSPEPLTAPRVEPSTLPRVDAASPEPREPSGTLTVAVPAEPTAWIVPEGDDLAAADLASIWGLPLYRVDASGRVVRALAISEEVSDDGRTLTMDLADGSWSDGTAVSADDVVATIEVLRATGLGHELDVVAEVTAEGASRVRIVLHQPTVRWQLLLGTVGVLPAHVLADGGLAGAATLAVTGGPFRLTAQQPGLGATFEAHPGSPLGPPATSTLHLRYVPSYDVALGLLEQGRLDAALGYLAVGPVARAERLGLEAAAPLGGTWVALRWSEDADLGAAQRRAVAAVVDVGEQVEGLGLGEVLDVPLLAGGDPPELDAPGATDIEEVGALSATLVVRADEEALALTGQLLEAQVRARGGRLQLRRERTPDDLGVAREADASLVVRRDPPRPDLTRDVPTPLRGAARAADAWPSAHDASVVEVLEAGAVEGWSLPLYRPPVAHVWRPGVVGIEASAWPGAGFTSAARWRLEEPS